VIKLAKSKWEYVKAKLHLVEKWARDVICEEDIAKALGISITTLSSYKVDHPEILRAIKRGKETLNTELENALIKKALGYDYEEKKVYTKTENGQAVTYTEITKKHQPPDTGALFGLLKNKDPEHYSDNPQMLQLKKQELELRERLAKEGNW
jgi:hypothetical protein